MLEKAISIYVYALYYSASAYIYRKMLPSVPHIVYTLYFTSQVKKRNSSVLSVQFRTEYRIAHILLHSYVRVLSFTDLAQTIPYLKSILSRWVKIWDILHLSSKRIEVF